MSFFWSSDNKSAVVDEGNHRVRTGTAGFSSRRAVVTSSSLCSQHGGWTRRSPVNSPSRQSKTSCYWLPKHQLSQTVLQNAERCSGSVYGGPSQLTTLTPHLCSPLFLLEVAPSILQNAFRLASQLLQLLHFTSWLVSLSNPIPCSFFLTRPSPSVSPLLWKARQMVRAKPSDVAVWLSRTLGHARWVCCKVIQVAPLRTGSSLSTFWSSATHQLYKTPFIDRFQCLFCFGFDLNAHPPYMPFQPALWLSLCLSLLACNASWVELWSKHQDNQKAMEKPQSKRLFTHQRKKDKDQNLQLTSFLDILLHE